MTTIASRTFRSTPQRDALSTWTAIVDLLTQGKKDGARTELLSIAGTAASLIADQSPKDAAIVVTCDGPRTRVYCLYDDDAIEGSAANEDALGFDPLNGNWHVSVPCPTDDLAWVQKALKKCTSRIAARDLADKTSSEEGKSATKAQSLEFNRKGFLGS